MTYFSRQDRDLILKHKLGEGRIVGGLRHDPREFTPVSTQELEDDLARLAIPFSRSIADNKQHPDYGKRILIFTLYQVEGRMPEYSHVWRTYPDDPFVVVGVKSKKDIVALPDRTQAQHYCNNMVAPSYVEHRPTKLVCHSNLSARGPFATDAQIQNAMAKLTPTCNV